MEKHHCKHFLCKICEFLDGEIEQTCCVEIEQHIEECEECRIVVSTMQTTMRVCRDLGCEDIPDTIRIRLHQEIRRRLFEEKLIEYFEYGEHDNRRDGRV